MKSYLHYIIALLNLLKGGLGDADLKRLLCEPVDGATVYQGGEHTTGGPE